MKREDWRAHGRINLQASAVISNDTAIDTISATAPLAESAMPRKENNSSLDASGTDSSFKIIEPNHQLGG